MPSSTRICINLIILPKPGTCEAIKQTITKQSIDAAATNKAVILFALLNIIFFPPKILNSDKL